VRARGRRCVRRKVRVVREEGHLSQHSNTSLRTGGRKGAAREGAGMAGSGKWELKRRLKRGLMGEVGVGGDHEHGPCAEAEALWLSGGVAAPDAGCAGSVAVFFFLVAAV